jgi:hypothetical protein
MPRIKFLVLLVCILAGVSSLVQAQVSEDSELKVRRAAECLRGISGLIEGQSAEDVANDNAHFVVLNVNRGHLNFPRTIIRLHKGLAQGLFPNIDQSRVAACMRGLTQMQPSH